MRGTGGIALRVRSEPTTKSAVVGELAEGSAVVVRCQIEGESVDGEVLWTGIVAPAGYVSNRYLDSGHAGFIPGVPRCDAAAPPPPKNTEDGPGNHLPLACGTSARIVQGPGGSFSHSTAQSRDAYDFEIPNDTPLVAVDDGVVSFVRGDVGPGDACYNGGGSGCANTVNYVVLAHADGTDTLYLHVNKPLVALGQTVKRGERVALSGGTGWSTGPHAHVQRQERCGIWICNSRPLVFLEAGVPKTGATVTSANCP